MSTRQVVFFIEEEIVKLGALKFFSKIVARIAAANPAASPEVLLSGNVYFKKILLCHFLLLHFRV